MENTSDSFMPRPLLFCLKSGRSVCYSVPDNSMLLPQRPLLPHEYRAKGNNDVERFLDHLENEQSAWKPAPQTGYYMLVHCPKEGRSMYHLCTINPLDSKYIIINPLDDDEVEF